MVATTTQVFRIPIMARGHSIDAMHAEHQALSTGQVIAFRQQTARAPKFAFDDRLARAGLAIAAQVMNAYDGTDPTTPSSVHVPTVIGVLATLAAEAALQAATLNRRFEARVGPGGWVQGGPADGILFSAADDGVRTIWQVIEAGAIDAGVIATELPDLETVLAHAEAHVGSKPYPVLTVASTYRPKALLRAAAARLRHPVQGFAAEEGLCTPHEQALACGAAIAHVIRSEARPEVLCRLAAEVLLGAARLEPLPFAAS
jgi:hypothetical protein